MTYPSQIDLGVTVEGTNVENSILNGYVKLVSNLGQRVDTCKFIMDNPTTTDIPNDWDEVIVYDGATKLFGGYALTNESDRDQGSFRLIHEVEC